MSLKDIIKNLISHIDEEAGALRNIPNFMIRLSMFMSINAILQAIIDITVEVLILFNVISLKLPFRLEFLFLTLISTVIAYLTLKGLREGNLDVTRNNLLLGLIVESFLVLGDLYLLITIRDNFWPVFFFRLFFIVLTSVNIAIISYLIIRNVKTRISRANHRF
jgi:hypothetical protein